MSAPDTLAAFLQRSLARFPPSTPGRKYLFDFWDHGSGWKGYGVDATCSAAGTYIHAGCNMFSMATMARGLAAGLGSVKLDIIGFDACLMAMFEVGTILAPFAQ